MTRLDLSGADREDRADHDPKHCKTCRTINPQDGTAENYLDCGHIKRAFTTQLNGARVWCDACDDWAFVTDPDPRPALTDADVERMLAEERVLRAESRKAQAEIMSELRSGQA